MNLRLTGAAACSLGALAACGPAPTSLPASAPPTPPAIAPSTSASVLPTPLPSPSTLVGQPWNPGPWLSASAPAPGCSCGIVAGNVYDEDGAPVSDVLVTIRSLDPSVPYLASVLTVDGSWVVNNVPDGVNMELIATKEGWTSRTRVGSFQQRDAEVRNIVNFGQGTEVDDEDPESGAYFLSNRPEVVETVPGAKLDDPRTLAYELRLSEPLDTRNQQRLAEALRLFPANRAAVPDSTDVLDRAVTVASYRDLSTISDVDPAGDGAQTDFQPDPADGGGWAYALGEDDAFVAGSRIRAEVAWNAAGTVATLTFRAPLRAAHDDEARYQVGLVAGADEDDRILDAAKRQLGTDRANDADRYPAAGFLLHNVFRRPELTMPDDARDGDARWAATHRMTSAFEVPRDERAPKLLAVAYETFGRDSRFVLRFDEPMVTFDGTTDGWRDPGLTFEDAAPGSGTSDGAEADPLARFSFAIGEDVEDVEGRDLADGPATRAFDATAGTFFGSAEADRGRAFRFLRANLTLRDRTDLERGVDDGRITLEIDPEDPTVLHLWVFNRAWIFADGLAGLKVQVHDVEDPAGNRIRPGEASATARI